MNAVALTVLLQLSTVAAGADTYEAAHARSMENGQPLVVLVGADWCGACQRMKSTVIPELKKNGALKQVAFATVNSDSQSQLASQLTTGTSIPQLVMYRKTSTGWMRSTLNGAHSSSEVSAFLSRTKQVSYTAPETQNVARPIAAYSP